jgi:hypothetical protein
MPRRSAEDRAAAHYRAGCKPPRPPDILSADAARLWRKIVGSKPYDYFDFAAQEMLAQFCELCITQRLNLQTLRLNPLDEERQRCASRLQATINSCAVKLRLSPSTVLSKKHAILSEKEVDVTSDDNVIKADVLFGGGKTRF